jgi:hypothetical protein
MINKTTKVETPRRNYSTEWAAKHALSAVLTVLLQILRVDEDGIAAGKRDLKRQLAGARGV